MSASQMNDNHHVVSSFDDLSVTLDFPSSNLCFFLACGSPYITCSVSRPTALTISTVHAIISSSSSSSNNKYTIKLNNDQTWVIYTSSPADMSHSGPSALTRSDFSGIIRIALFPGDDPKYESILDRFSPCHPISGEAVFTKPFALKYKWKKKGECHGWSYQLMLAHLRLLSGEHVSVLKDFKYKSIDGLVGIVGDSRVLESKHISLTMHSTGGLKTLNNDSYTEIVSALRRDADDGLSSTPINATSSYFYGKLIAWAARLTKGYSIIQSIALFLYSFWNILLTSTYRLQRKKRNETSETK